MCQLMETKAPPINQLVNRLNFNYYEEDCSHVDPNDSVCPNNGTAVLNPNDGTPVFNPNSSCEVVCKCSPPYRRYNCDQYCTFTVQLGRNVPGRFDLGGSSVKNMKGCWDKCLKREKCLGFMYYRAFTYCYLKSESYYTLKSQDFTKENETMEYYSMLCD